MSAPRTATEAIVTQGAGAGTAGRERARNRTPRVGTHAFLLVMSVMWLAPILWALFTSLRPQADTLRYGYFSLEGDFNLDNYVTAWTNGGFAGHFLSSAIITLPSVVLVLALASMMAFVVSRYSWRFNVTLLIAFTAGNLLPAQVAAAPVFLIFRSVELPYSISDSGSLINTYVAVIIAETAFQVGFATFVLANFMKAIPHELKEAAQLDGASAWRQYWSIVLPLSSPALAAMGTLMAVWIYNGFFWPLLLIANADKLPVTTAINLLRGQFTTDVNLIAAGATIALIPTVLVYLLLQRYIVQGLTLGATKG